MDHVKPMLAQIICDSTREKGIIARFAMVISGIFIRKVTKLVRPPILFLGMYYVYCTYILLIDTWAMEIRYGPGQLGPQQKTLGKICPFIISKMFKTSRYRVGHFVDPSPMYAKTSQHNG